MPSYKRVFAMLAKGGASQQDIAAICGCSKRDVSSAARYARESGTPAEELALMSEDEIRERAFPRKRRAKNPGKVSLCKVVAKGGGIWRPLWTLVLWCR